MKLEESQKQRLPDLGQPDGAPPPYGLDTSPSLAVSDSDAEIDFDSKAILDKFPHELTFLFLPDVVDLEARLEVYAKDVPRLMEQGFYWTEANGRAIYYFDGINPGESFNAICDDRPLQGWWPWPKKSQG
ncbi:hypothetical protein TOPH_03819 [Tolypocladium ophioglossoides CBS 100239]|uniref:Uncharacterized protein n=1 Tax=Tolypocladium ophioglossoides (strain CBS 100239) TaxID=1163406 RepID=A0A0L0NCD4_TOLOC|nr:hypothetical protein TOPH_03819 [Tolypocladium ophioglossoides CBS 100239]